MKTDTLTTAIRLGQLLTLLTPLGNASKTFNKRLAKVRSSLHEQVILSAFTADAAPGRRAALRLTQMHDALLASMLEVMDVKELLRRAPTERAIYPTHVAKKEGTPARVRPRNDCDTTLFQDVLAVQMLAESGVSISQEQRAKVIRAFTSAVRNSSWLATLMRLEVGLPVATTEGARLATEHSSHGGRLKLDENLKVLCPSYSAAAPVKGKRTKKVAVAATGLYAVNVVLSIEALLAQADIATLAAVSLPKGASPAGHDLTALLGAASKPTPVPADSTAEAVAQGLVDALVVGLTARQKAINGELVKAQEVAEEAAKLEAVQALKQLSPKLRQALKANPDLLKSL